MNPSIVADAARERLEPTRSTSPAPAREAALDLMRASITLLVIVHHAVLAYHRYAPAPGALTGKDLMWGAFPVVDAARAPGLDVLTLWNDSFFMAAMFLLAGLFVPAGLARKGPGRFLRDRAVRLGVPFIVAAAALAPLAYLPACLERAAATGKPGFWPAWLGLGVWVSGPAWFLWVLLAFSAVAAGLYVVTPRALGWLAGLGAWSRARPAWASGVLGVAATVAYFAATRWVSPFVWWTWWPFAVQTSRIGLYAVYFFYGYALGAGARGDGIGGAWLAAQGALARRWAVWQAAAGVVFVGFVAALIAWLMASAKGGASPLVGDAATVLFAVSGAVTTWAVLAFFARWGHGRGAVTRSLARNAYGMYLLHYAIVTWTQYALLGVTLPGLLKAAVVSVVGIGASWAGASLLRRLPGVGRVVG